MEHAIDGDKLLGWRKSNADFAGAATAAIAPTNPRVFEFDSDDSEQDNEDAERELEVDDCVPNSIAPRPHN
jgi:hypothetical protein